MRGTTNPMDRDVDKALNALLRGISAHHVETVRDDWRDLLAMGDIAVPTIRSKLAAPVWDSYSRWPLRLYLGVLLALLHEVDAAAFGAEIVRFRAMDMHPLHRKTVDILALRERDRPAGQVGLAMPVYVARDIKDPARVVAKLDRWCKTPGLGLENVARIDVTAPHPQMDYLGLYDLYCSGIILTQPVGNRLNPLFWLEYIFAELTFYHEVGHHACNHTEAGQVAEQGKEADAYAASMFRLAHPLLTAFGGRTVKPSLAPLRFVFRFGPRPARPKDSAQ